MSKKIEGLTVGLDEDLEEKLKWLTPNYGSFQILRKSVDARRSRRPHFVYSLEVFDPGEDAPPKVEPLEKIKFKQNLYGRPIIVGSGPAGLFAALRFVERGVPCVLLEQGSPAEKRIRGINQYWRYGKLDPKNNVCFGEGGAGLYSDGKLITRIKSPHIAYIMNRLVKFGAPAEIEYLSNPHVGSDRIRRVIPVMRSFLSSNGCEIIYDTKVTELLSRSSQSGFEVYGVKTEAGETLLSDNVVLACGHSAEDLFLHLKQSGVYLELKSFAVGLRIEHPQEQINRIQYREDWHHPKLGAAPYKLTFHRREPEEYGVYTFCMCPGGYVLSSGTDDEGIVSNGMSNYHRNSPYANSAVVVTISSEQFKGDLWGGLNFRKQLEKEAKNRVTTAGGTRELPAQRLIDFLENKESPHGIPTSCPSGVRSVRLDSIFSKAIYEKLCEGLFSFDKNLKGFISPHAILHGIETRTSCPIRITRNDETLESLSHRGLYPCGEGAGYAGGITSAACDGIKVAEAVISKFERCLRTL